MVRAKPGQLLKYSKNSSVKKIVTKNYVGKRYVVLFRVFRAVAVFSDERFYSELLSINYVEQHLDYNNTAVATARHYSIVFPLKNQRETTLQFKKNPPLGTHRAADLEMHV